ncbi:hypothetical protein GGX14DRAFT_541785 [Mycena pura]|uniref:Uncharacterized protein n=1 Tax=Mycena pura TaxID=153505 RepID=A0AAD6VME1_9AGAR|nr:hypothetical protein GGX14DRAFT_541785 [Mycena pura]
MLEALPASAFSKHKWRSSGSPSDGRSFGYSAVSTLGVDDVDLCAVLVLLMQRLAMQRTTERMTLTAMHDNISAWAGLGSALATLLDQVSVPASVLGTLSIVSYLGCISTLHISIPASLSVDTFNATAKVAIPASTVVFRSNRIVPCHGPQNIRNISSAEMPYESTSGMPEYANSSVINPTRNYMLGYPAEFLPWRGILDDSQMLGLSNGSLYEVLDATTPGNDKAQLQVSAIGFNITCGYLSVKIKDVLDGQIDILVDGVPGSMTLGYGDLVPNTVSLGPLGAINNSLSILTTIAISDSEGHQGSPILFDQQSQSAVQNLTQLNLNSSQFELLQCSQSLVAQTGVISAQSNTIISGSLYPDIHKTQSTWISGLELDFISQDSSLLGDDLWSAMFEAGYSNEIDLRVAQSEYLMSYLGLDPYANTSAPALQLHNIENAVSNLVAMLFWTGGHIIPDQWYTRHLIQFAQGEIPPKLAVGNATIIRQETLQTRLNLNLIAVSLGLITSVIQMSLCINFLRTPTKPEGSRLQGVGLLANIWWWRSQRKSSTFITDVQQPTESNLRTAGLIPLQQYTNQPGHNDTGSKENELASRDLSSSSLLQIISASFTAKTSTVCMLMHVLLVMIHIIALVFAVQRKEHSIMFSLDKQQAVSFICKFATTAFGTIFYAMLIYLTQRLATTNTMHKYSLLTAIRDKSLAWTGVGSAFSTLYEQIKSPEPCLEILIICLYLATISGLHVTTSALVSVESFNLSISTKVQTWSIPEWSDTVDNSTLEYIAGNGRSLQWINSLDDSKKLGLSNGSLYDVLEQAYPGSGLTDVSALGFNITCGYVPDIAAPEIGYIINVSSLTEKFNMQFDIPGPNSLLIVYSMPSDTLPADSIVLCTQNSVYDSNDALGSPVTLPHANVTLQFLECSNTRVRQMGRVNASTRLLDPSSLHPTIHKHTSAWRAYQNVSNTGVLDQTSLLGGNYWIQILTQFRTHPKGSDLDYGSMSLTQQLGLNPNTLADFENSATALPAQMIYLHDIENALSNLVASLFWTGGNVHLSPLAIQNQFGPVNPPNLSAGNATVKQVVLTARLNISLPAVSIGLAGSIILLVLIGWICIGTKLTNSSNPPLTRLGILQIIWIFEHHPELHEILEQVDDPTDDNLRSAGLVNVCLADAFSSTGHGGEH